VAAEVALQGLRRAESGQVGDGFDVEARARLQQLRRQRDALAHQPVQRTLAGAVLEPPETLFVVYCAGPHCNGAHRGALRLARLGRPVKLMIGGVTGWVDEGYVLATGA
jgi:rhodanese-related sulfurtransferase